MDADPYLLELVRYIHLNPVRSGIVRRPEDYPWSGHRVYLGLEIIPWLTTAWVLSMFSGRTDRARRAYREFVEEGKEGGHRGEFGKGSQMDSRILGDTLFIEKVLGPAPERSKRRVTVERILSHVCKRFSIREDELSGSGKDRRLSRIRGILAWLVLDSGSLTLAELSKRVHRDSSTLSSAARSFEKEAQTNTGLRQLMSEMTEELFEIQISKA